MLQIEGLILYFLLLVLEILLNLSLDVDHKCNRFFKIFLEKSLEFVLSKRSVIISLYLGYMLLLAKVDLVFEEQSCKKKKLVAHGTGCVKIVPILSTKIVVLYL